MGPLNSNIYTVRAGILVSGNAEDYIAAFNGGEFYTFFQQKLDKYFLSIANYYPRKLFN